MPVGYVRLLLLVLHLLTMPALSAIHDLPDGTTVRIQSSKLGPGWHLGKMQITEDGCAIVWNQLQRVPAGVVASGDVHSEFGTPGGAK